MSSERGDKYSKIDLEYEDRKTYKNISIDITELPPTPTRFRDKYTRNYQPAKSKPQRTPIPQKYNRFPVTIVQKKYNSTQPQYGNRPTAFESAINRTRDSAARLSSARPQTYQMEYEPQAISRPHRPGTYAGDAVHLASPLAPPWLPVDLPKRLKPPTNPPPRSQDTSQTGPAPPTPQDATSIGKLVIAVSDYSAKHCGELSFRTGDVITSFFSFREGWQCGRLNGLYGDFPLTHVKDHDENDRPQEGSSITEGKDWRRSEDGYRAVSSRMVLEEEEATKQRLRERQIPIRTTVVRPDGVRHRIDYDDGDYHWE